MKSNETTILYVILVDIIVLRHFTTFTEPSPYGRIILLISDYSSRVKEKFKAKLKHNEGEMCANMICFILINGNSYVSTFLALIILHAISV